MIVVDMVQFRKSLISKINCIAIADYSKNVSLEGIITIKL